MKRLKELRKAKNMTQASLAMKTGIDQSLISKYERGEKMPQLDTLIILADYFRVSLDELIGREIPK